MLNKRSFTLIELLVVILIVGILVAVTIPIMQGYIWQARFSEVYAVVGTIARAKQAYRLEHGTYEGQPPYPTAECYAGSGYAAGSTRVQQDLGIEIDENCFFTYLVYPSSVWPNNNTIYFKEPGYQWAWLYNYGTKTWVNYGSGDGGPARKYFRPW